MIRVSIAAAISLNEVTRASRSGSLTSSSRVSKRPCAIDLAASEMSVSGLSRPPLAHRPIPTPTRTVSAPPTKRIRARLSRVFSTSARGTTSK